MPKLDLNEVLFLFVRHGETNSNEKDVYRSWSNQRDAQLNADGRAQAEAAGEYIKSLGAPVETIVTDSLDRTMETGEILSRVLNPSQMVAIRQLHPLNVGDWTGKSKKEFPTESLYHDHGKKPPNGESIPEFDERQFQLFKDVFTLADSMIGGRVVIVGHGSNVSFLHNRVFNKGEKRIGYEGLVDPGGVIAASLVDGLIPLLRIRGEKGAVEEKSIRKASDSRLTEEAAGYMELDDAVKDADCLKVYVEGGVSKALGCCNLFQPEDASTVQFKCGTCEYLTPMKEKS